MASEFLCAGVLGEESLTERKTWSSAEASGQSARVSWVAGEVLSLEVSTN